MFYHELLQVVICILRPFIYRTRLCCKFKSKQNKTYNTTRRGDMERINDGIEARKEEMADYEEGQVEVKEKEDFGQLEQGIEKQSPRESSKETSKEGLTVDVGVDETPIELLALPTEISPNQISATNDLPPKLPTAAKKHSNELRELLTTNSTESDSEASRELLIRQKSPGRNDQGEVPTQKDDDTDREMATQKDEENSEYNQGIAHNNDNTESSSESINEATNESTNKVTNEATNEDQSQIIIKESAKHLRNKRKIKIVDPSAYVMEPSSKRVTGKFIDRFWEPLPPQTMDSLDRILNIALTRAIERYGTLSKTQKLTKKMVEAQKVLARTWINNSESKSFKSRVDVTPLPPTSTMSTKPNTLGDILSFDALLRRKTFLETYLLAELKQLKELEKHHDDLERSYHMDSKYLDEFRKTADHQKQRISRDMASRGHLVETPLVDIHLLKTGRISSLFDPDVDQDTVEILQLLRRHLDSVAGNTDQLLSVNTKLESVYSLLDII